MWSGLISTHWLFKQDKLLHFIVGILMAQTFILVCPIALNFWIAAGISLVLSTAIMYGKELWDEKHGGVYDIRDFYAGMIGIAYGLAAMIVEYIKL